MSHIGIAILVLAVTGTLGAVMGMAIVGVVAVPISVELTETLCV